MKYRSKLNNSESIRDIQSLRTQDTSSGHCLFESILHCSGKAPCWSSSNRQHTTAEAKAKTNNDQRTSSKEDKIKGEMT